MKDLSSLDVHFLVEELKPKLVGARFDKAYQLARDDGKKELLLQFHQSGQGKQLLRVLLPGLAYLASAKSAFPKQPPHFCIFLRKRLVNARVEAINQVGMDRIFEFIFTKTMKDAASPRSSSRRAASSARSVDPDEAAPPTSSDGSSQSLALKDGGDAHRVTLRLIIELLAPGNVLLLGRKPIKGGGLSDEVILNLLRPQNFSSRTLRGGIAYEPPPSFDLRQVDDDTIIERATTNAKESLVKTLAIALSLGGEYAELVCQRAGLDKNKEHFSRDDLKKAVTVIKHLLDEKPAPFIVEETIHFFGKGEGDENSEGQSFDTMSAAMDVLYTDAPVQQVKGKKKMTKLEKLQAIQHQQERQFAGFERSSTDNQKKGELIYEHYQELKDVLQAVKKGEQPKSKLFKKHDKKNGTVTVEIKE